jgi:hypothetical protein
MPAAIDGIEALLSTYHVDKEPFWFTEGSWGNDTTDGPADLTDDEEIAFLAQQYIFLWSKGAARYYWYSWDNVGTGPEGQGFGTLWDATGGIHPAGTAYGLLYEWLLGSTHPASPCAQASDLTWTCALTLSTGTSAEIVWNPSASIAWAATGFATYRTLDDGTVSPISSDSIGVGSKPILVVAGP